MAMASRIMSKAIIAITTLFDEPGLLMAVGWLSCARLVALMLEELEELDELDRELEDVLLEELDDVLLELDVVLLELEDVDGEIVTVTKDASDGLALTILVTVTGSGLGSSI